MSATLDLREARAFVIGWAGSTPRQLRGVMRWYRERNSVPHAHCADLYPAVRRPDGWPREGERLLRAMRREPGPRIVHAFSNAGFWTLAAGLAAMTDDERRSIVAVTLDSAPGIYPTIDPAYYATYSARAMMPPLLKALRRPPTHVHPLLTPPMWAFMRLWYYVSGAARRTAQASLRQVRELGDFPLRVVYSADDALVPAGAVEAFLASLGDRDVDVVRFATGGHVRHMIEHRAAYFDGLEAFLARALRVADRSAG
ncbi:MAG: DUF829 domain-containing protein [Sandaracinaceae bacterium]